MESKKKHKMLTIRGKLIKDPDETKQFTRADGTNFNVLNFTLVKKHGEDAVYINCSAFNNKIEQFDYQKGDQIQAWGYFDIRKKGEKTFKNFIVMKFNKDGEIHSETESTEKDDFEYEEYEEE